MPKPTYYAVIFSSMRTEADPAGYETISEKMMSLAKLQTGYIGIESVRSGDGKGITVSYWQTLEDIKNWKLNTEHLEAQRLGRLQWYSNFKIRICKVEREY